MADYVAPDISAKSFTCPHCGVLARQYKWGYAATGQPGQYNEDQLSMPVVTIVVSRCENCGENCVWMKRALVYPDRGNAPQPNPDMPADVRADYEEAARIHQKSPRGAAALLRLSIQKLMVDLRQPGKNINDDIAALVANGLPRKIQQALDVVRVTGNNAVHPGQIDANDTEVATQLFSLVNIIVDYSISFPARIQETYEKLPASAKAQIERRDAPKP